MKKTVITCISIFFVSIISGQNLDTLMVKANNLFTQNNFQEAIDVYELILENGFESSELYYNLGNAYYKQNVIAKAILNYERALILNPNDQDIQYNLELTNRLVVDKIEILPTFFLKSWIVNVKNTFSSDNWALTSIITFILTLVFISLFLYSRSYTFKKFSFWLSFLFIIITVISIIFSYQQKQGKLSNDKAIIISPTVTIKSSPDISGTDLFVIHEGTKVTLDDKISDWNEIRLSDGSVGWIKSDDFEII